MVAFGLVGLPLVGQTVDRVSLARLEADIVREHNIARTRPGTYAAHLQTRLTRFDDRLLRVPDRVPLVTQEGPDAVREALRVLERQTPLEPMFIADGMSQGARDHVHDHGPSGAIGHRGTDGSQPWDRISRYGTWSGLTAENIAYGPATGREVVLQLIVDDGVPDRAHRLNILEPEFATIGVACGPHREFEIMCVITYASEYRHR